MIDKQEALPCVAPHGALRGEVRFDHLAEGQGDLYVSSANQLGFKLGFDLWIH